jgi:hypothetical protein
VRHTEEVYPDVVAERAAMLAGLGCATSAAMLMPVSGGERLTALLSAAIDELGAPTVSTVDSRRRGHEMWLLGKGERQDELLALAQEHPLLVADGNHRVAAAAVAGRGSLLALVTAGPDLRIGPIHRVLTGTGLDLGEMVHRWRAAGLDTRPSGDRTPPSVPGEVVVLSGEVVLRISLPHAEPSMSGPMIDHHLVEQVMIRCALGVDPDGPSLRPLLPGAPVPVDRDAVLLLAPVPFADLLAVHAAGSRMPRKATYFTPKPRSGLLLADI